MFDNFVINEFNPTSEGKGNGNSALPNTPFEKLLFCNGSFQNGVYKTAMLFMTFIMVTRKCPLRGHILAPPEGLRAKGKPGINLGVNPRGQGVIPRRFK